MKERYQKPFWIIVAIGYIALFVSVMGAVLFLGGCSMDQGYPVVEVPVDPDTLPDVISYSNNYLKLQSDEVVYLVHRFGHYDTFWIKEGVTLQFIIHGSTDYARFYNTPDFVWVDFSGVSTIGEGRDMTTDFGVLEPPTMPYYFQIEAIVNGVSTFVDYCIY